MSANFYENLIILEFHTLLINLRFVSYALSFLVRIEAIENEIVIKMVL